MAYLAASCPVHILALRCFDFASALEKEEFQTNQRSWHHLVTCQVDPREWLPKTLALRDYFAIFALMTKGGEISVIFLFADYIRKRP